MTINDYTHMPEIELIRIIKNPKSKETEYNLACEVLIKKYEKMIHYHWWKLQQELNKTGYVESVKEDYYDEAYEALFKAITKVDLDRITDENFKILQLASWYITNVRTKLRKKVLKNVSKNKSLVTINLKEDDESLTCDPDVEKAYNDQIGYKTDPIYSYEIQEGEDNCRNAVRECFNIWDDEQRKIYEYLEKGKNKTEISQMMGLPVTKVYTLTKKMKSDMKKILDYENLHYSYN